MECLIAINKAKEDFRFDEYNYIVESDRIILHAWTKNPKPVPRKRLYCYQDRIILHTDTKYPDEIEPTRELLAYERAVDPCEIQVIEV